MTTTAEPDSASSARRSRWLIALVVGFGLAVVIRLLLLPTDGLRGDIDQFVLWAHNLVTKPFGNAYDQDITFPPVMVYIWGLLATLMADFQTVTTGADPAIRAVMKVPASLADLAIAGLVAYELRARPLWAIVGALVIALHPAVIDVSAWWGQYESIYVLGGLVAYLLAVRGHPLPAAAALAVALMTKPQALPLLVPFGAWFLARGGIRGAVLAGLVGAGVIALVWLPFVSADGVAGYARNLGDYQGERFAILSLRAWNVWWIVQELGAGGSFVSDQGAILGPITLRHVGYVIAGILEVVVFLAVYRSPTPKTLALGLAASVLVAFMFLTTMHERYAYGALVFLVLLIADRSARWTLVIFSVAFTLNLLAAVPPTSEIGALLPVGGALGVIGSLTMLGVTVAVLAMLLRSASEPEEATSEASGPQSAVAAT